MDKITTMKQLNEHLTGRTDSNTMAATIFIDECRTIIEDSSLNDEMKRVLYELCQVQRETFAKYESALQLMLID